jgi:hypothetical protein
LPAACHFSNRIAAEDIPVFCRAVRWVDRITI